MPDMTPQEFESKQDELFHHLSYVADLFTEEGISFQIADGTLLGAVREGNILKTEERDFDLDIIDSEVQKVRELANKALKDGYEFVERTPNTVDFDIGYAFWDMKAERTATGGAGFLIMHNGEFVGDVYIYTVFNDGLARRYCLDSEGSVNAKMTIPAWFLEASTPVQIRGKEFPGSRAPEKILAKTYGPDWTTPIAPGEFGPGQHPDSGGIYDSDMEHLVIFAIENGWQPNYGNKTQWSRRIKKVGSYAGRRWVMSHDPYYILDDISLFSKAERDVLKARIESGPSKELLLIVMRVICARLSLRKRDTKVELAAAKKKTSLLKEEMHQTQMHLENTRLEAKNAQECTRKTQAEFRRFKERRSVKIAVTFADFFRKIRKKLRG